MSVIIVTCSSNHATTSQHSILQYEIHWHLPLKKNHLRFTKMRGFVVVWEKSLLIWRRNSCEWWRMKVAALLSSIKCAQSPGFGVTHCVSSSHCYHYHIHHIHHNLHQQSGVSHGEIRFANTIINYTDLNIQETFGMLGGSKFHFHFF